jgi:hypothetical protein
MEGVYTINYPPSSLSSNVYMKENKEMGIQDPDINIP